KTYERRSLTKAVKRFRVNVMPYTYCFKLNKVYKIAEESSRYNKLEAKDKEVADIEARVKRDLMA
ncbi:hypothetical protein CSPAE12_00533, partial [Colletotrichum incanum]